MKITKRLISSAVAACFLAGATASVADIAIIVNPESGLSNADAKQIAAAFLGKRGSIAGVSVTPVDQEEGQASRDEFYTKVVHKNASQLNAYWSPPIHICRRSRRG